MYFRSHAISTIWSSVSYATGNAQLQPRGCAAFPCNLPQKWLQFVARSMELWEEGKHQWNCGLAKLSAAPILVIASMKVERVSGERFKARGINMKQLHGNEQLEFWSMWERLHWFHYNFWCRQRLCLQDPSCLWCLNKWAPEKVVSPEVLSIRTSSCHLLALKAVSSGWWCRDQPWNAFIGTSVCIKVSGFVQNLAQDATFPKQKEHFHLKYARAILNLFGTLNV